MKYVIKSNLPLDSVHTPFICYKKGVAKGNFFEMSRILSEKYLTKVVFRNKPLRGTIQVEIDGFYYYVELYQEK